MSAAPDRIELLDLVVDASIGVYPHERLVRQRLRIDILVEHDLRAAARADDVSLTIDYDRLAKIAEDVCTTRHHDLIETVAEEISARVLSELGVRAVEVRVAKPGAVRGAAQVAVRIRREQRGRRSADRPRRGG